MYNVQFPNLGLRFKINRVAFSIFGLDIYYYALCITGGIILCVINALRIGRKYKINDDDFTDVIMFGVIMGIICARAYYVIFSPVKYESLFDMINIRDGGLAIYGGIIGGIGFGCLGCKVKKLDVLNVVDIAAVCFLLGQAIGRWGNFFNQEAFGTNTNSLFGMFSEGTKSYLTYAAPKLAREGITVYPDLPVHPTFLYESVWCIIGFIRLSIYFDRRKFKGEILLMYLGWYGLGRFFIEGIRTDSLEAFAGMRISQLIALVSVVISVVLIYIFRKKVRAKNNG